MKFGKIVSVMFLLVITTLFSHAQTAKTIDEMESVHKECMRIKEDSTVCSRRFLAQMDSMLLIVFNEVKQNTADDKQPTLIVEQAAWNKKKGEFFKKQDETFVYNLKDGSWTKDMIRLIYRQKADYVLKRIRVLLKRLN